MRGFTAERVITVQPPGAPSAKLEDLRVPPGNQLEPLKGDRKGQHSIRVNKKWRVCFRWTEMGPADAEIVDYH